MRTSREARVQALARSLAIAAALSVIGAGPALAAPQALSTEMVSVSSVGHQGHGDSFPTNDSISSSGQYVGFCSNAANLVRGDTNGAFDVFRHDRADGETIRVSTSSTGEEGNGDSCGSAISGDGNIVAFDSSASNLVPGDTNGANDVFVHNVATGTTIRVSVSALGRESRHESFGETISEDGTVVGFNSRARLVRTDTNRRLDAYAYDLATGNLSLVSVAQSGAGGNDDSFVESVSGDGRLVVFSSFASNLVPGDTNGAQDLFIRDMDTSTTTRVSVSSAGEEADGDSFNAHISANGDVLAFSSAADNLVPNDTHGFVDLFARDLTSGTTTLLSRNASGQEGNADSCCSKGISADGRFIAFRSFAVNLVSDDAIGHTSDVFLVDRTTGAIVLASVSDTGEPGNRFSYNAGLSEDGQWVLFGSVATNFPPGGDHNGRGNGDTYVRGPYAIAGPLGPAGATTHGRSVWTAPPSPNMTACADASSVESGLVRSGPGAGTSCRS